ncbi:hypothetical protein HanXRQr2_Chr14g0637531 [Helianthus annuus]|uniref:Uncharacterized protein n=1 Tax=Helianthus annuus TaxID=4232 RepID=A0A9K3H7Y9_HELAN|nr:hypothetical protein HanXRQr2_Chr14g0637531 [Helianthus annuus]KAJ0839834.1 hypothetical protein HanPSC8_Chr14g0611521 [Helianthus annuus]
MRRHSVMTCNHGEVKCKKWKIGRQSESATKQQRSKLQFTHIYIYGG